jgi:HEAT repeat protein
MQRALTWSYRNLLLRPWYILWAALDRVHALLANAAILFGAHFPQRVPRYTIFCLVFGLVYLIGFIAPHELGFAAYVFGLFGVIAISQEWARNEHKRSEIAKQICFTRESSEVQATPPLPVKPLAPLVRQNYPSPDKLADLRVFALVSAGQLLVLLPLLGRLLHDWQGLFVVDDNAMFGNWLRFLLDKTYLKALPDWSYLKELHEQLIQYSSPQTNGEKWAVTIAWGLLYYVLVQGAFREWQIHQNLSDACTAAQVDPVPAILQGRRVVSRLVYRLGESGVSTDEQKHILIALGQIRDEQAFATVQGIAEDTSRADEVRSTAAIVLGQLGMASSLGVLRELLQSHIPLVRKGAVIGLHEYPHSGALEYLLEKLDTIRSSGGYQKEDPNVRGELALAIGIAAAREADSKLRKQALSAILGPPSMLQDSYLRVRSRAGIALRLIGNTQAVEPLRQLIETNTNAKLMVRVMPSLVHLANSTDSPTRVSVVRTLLVVLQAQENDDIRIAVSAGLGQLLTEEKVSSLLKDEKTTATWEALIKEVTDVLAKTLLDSLQAEHTAVAEALAKALQQMGPDHKKQADQVRDSHKELKSQKRVARVTNEKLSVEKRCKAADKLGELDRPHAEAELRKMLERTDTPSPLKAAIEHALGRMTKPKGEHSTDK